MFTGNPGVVVRKDHLLAVGIAVAQGAGPRAKWCSNLHSPRTSAVTLGNSPNLPGPQCPTLKNR